MVSPDTASQAAGMSILALGQGFFVGPMCACMVAPLATEYVFARLGIQMAPALVIMAGSFISLASIIIMGRWPFGDPAQAVDPPAHARTALTT